MKRYDWSLNANEMLVYPDGDFVLFVDHEAAIKQAEKEIEELKSGIYEGVYLSACYCAEGHICSPCNIKMKIAIKQAVEEEREACVTAIRARGANKEEAK